MSDLVITGVIDGPLPGGLPKAIELTAINDIPDLSVYGVGFANNGNGTDGEEFTLSGSASAGQKIYISVEETAFTNFFGFAPTLTTGFASIDGNDAIELFLNDVVVDVFGQVDIPDQGQSWHYEDGWAARNDLVPSPTFNDATWSFSEPDALDGEVNNATASNPFPIPTVYIVESEDGTNVSEDGLTDTYTVRLSTQPTSTVVVTINPDAQTSLNDGAAGSPVLLTFTPENFNQPQVIQVSAVGDGTPVERSITHTVTSNDPDYNSNNGQENLVVNISNPDSSGAVIPQLVTDPGVTIVETDGITSVSEGGGITDTYSIVLNTAPTADVTITVTPDAETGLNGAAAGTPITLTFTPQNFSTPQIVEVTAVSDAITEGEHTSTITHSASSTDPNYDSVGGFTIPDVTATILDTGITIVGVPSDAVAEGGISEYQVILNTVPTADVTVTIDPDDQLDLGSGAGVPVNIVFSPGADGFSLSQTVPVTAVSGDAIEGLHTGQITHTSSSVDPAYNNLTVDGATFNISEPGISIVQTGGGTTVSEEGITDQYNIVLNTEPTAPVTVTVTPDGETDLGNGAGVAITLVFDPGAADFSLSQTVTVTAVNDGEPEGNHQSSITHTATSADPSYNNSPVPTLVADVIDCFLPGTHILTDTGERLVEELKIGDRLQAPDGTLAPIKWIGIQTCYTDGTYHPLRTYPIQIKAGALGKNQPLRDLYVSPDHALLIEGLLVNAGALENGDSIVQPEPSDESFVYYHIELEKHGLIVAEGTPAESYLPQKQDRNTFDNGDEYAALYPHSNMQALVPLSYPRVCSKRQLPRFLSKHLEAIAAGLPQTDSPSVLSEAAV